MPAPPPVASSPATAPAPPATADQEGPAGPPSPRRSSSDETGPVFLDEDGDGNSTDLPARGLQSQVPGPERTAGPSWQPSGSPQGGFGPPAADPRGNWGNEGRASGRTESEPAAPAGASAPEAGPGPAGAGELPGQGGREKTVGLRRSEVLRAGDRPAHPGVPSPASPSSPSSPTPGSASGPRVPGQATGADPATAAPSAPEQRGTAGPVPPQGPGHTQAAPRVPGQATGGPGQSAAPGAGGTGSAGSTDQSPGTAPASGGAGQSPQAAGGSAAVASGPQVSRPARPASGGGAEPGQQGREDGSVGASGGTAQSPQAAGGSAGVASGPQVSRPASGGGAEPGQQGRSTASAGAAGAGQQVPGQGASGAAADQPGQAAIGAAPAALPGQRGEQGPPAGLGAAPGPGLAQGEPAPPGAQQGGGLPGAAAPSWSQPPAGLPAQPQSGGPDAVTPWRPPADDPFARAARQEARPGGLGRRFGARLVDLVLTLAVGAGAAFPFVGKAVDHINAKVEAVEQAGVTQRVWLIDGTTGSYLALVVGALLVFGLLYEVLPTARWGRTLGKKLFGLSVVNIEGYGKPAFGKSVLRWLVHGVLGLLVVGLVNAMWCLFDRPWRQCWHDKVAGTFVAKGSAGDGELRL
nr:RDD family protein [Streptomyces oryzae]